MIEAGVPAAHVSRDNVQHTMSAPATTLRGSSTAMPSRLMSWAKAARSRGARTVDFDAPDRAHKLDGFQRATRLLAGPKQAERRGVRACDLIDHHGRGGTDPHTGELEFVHERERPLPGQPAPMQLASVLGLTERQLDVLVLMTQGRQ